MASTNTNRKSLAEMTPPAVPFSYAQAARGMPPSSTPPSSTPPSSTPPSQASRAPSGSLTPGKEAVAQSTPAASDASNSTNMAADAEQNSVALSTKDTGSQSSESTVMGSGMRSTSARMPHQLQNGAASPTSPEFGASSVSTLQREDDSLSAQNIASSESTWESKSQSSLQEKAAETPEAENEKDKDHDESSKDEPPPVSKPILHEAPIPSVNIWKQRAAGQQKGKPTAPNSATSNNASAPAAASAISDAAKVTRTEARFPRGRDEADRNRKDVGKATNHDNAPQNHGDRSTDDVAQRMQKTPQTREKVPRTPMSASLPSLGDSESWPTPLIAQDDDQKRSQGKTGKAHEKDGTSAAPKSKTNWVTVPITPSVVFNTPLPNTAPRRGGRGGGRGARDSAGRGGASMSKMPRDGERVDPPQSPMPNGEQSSRRGRPHEAGRSVSPPKARRSTIDDMSLKRDPKMSVPPFRDHTVKDNTAADSVNGTAPERQPEDGHASQDLNGASHSTMRGVNGRSRADGQTEPWYLRGNVSPNLLESARQTKAALIMVGIPLQLHDTTQTATRKTLLIGGR